MADDSQQDGPAAMTYDIQQRHRKPGGASRGVTQPSPRSDLRSDVLSARVGVRPERGMKLQEFGLHASRAQDSKHTPVRPIFPNASNFSHHYSDKDGYDADEDNEFEDSTITTNAPSTAHSTPSTDHSPQIPPLPNSPLSPRWDSLGYDRSATLSPTSPAVSSLHSRSSNATDEIHFASEIRDEFPSSPVKMSTPETPRVDNFSRPRKPSIKQPYNESPRAMATNHLPTEPSHLDISPGHPLSWTRERGQSISSNISAATFSSVPGRPPPEMHSREHLRSRGRTPHPPPTRYPLSYNRAESTGPSFSRDPIHRMASLPSEELRSSYRSQLSASTAQGTAITERSSIATKSSSRTSVYGAADDSLSINDIMGMYEKGFYDDSAPEDNNEMVDSRPGTAKSELSRRRTAMLDAMTVFLPTPESPDATSDSGQVEQDSVSISHDPDEHDSSSEQEGPEEGPEEISEEMPEMPEILESTHLDSIHDTEDGYSPLPPSRHPTVSTIAEDDDERDRYGFRKSNQYINREQYDNWNQGYTEYLERRRKKWTAFLREHGLMTDKPNRFPPRSNKTKRFVRKGIPPDWRGAAWFYYAGGPAVVAKHAGLYDGLLKQKAKGVDVEAIERDLHRTFPDNIKFRSGPVSLSDGSEQALAKETEGITPVVEKPMIVSLRRVLHAFAIYNPKIGYCQSLNFLAGLLLLFVESEENAFWLLNIIARVYLPGTHETSLEGANVDLGVLMSSLRESMPNVWAKIGGELDGTDVVWAKSWRHRHRAETTRLPPITLCMTAWFMSCYIGTLPIESTLRVWDVFFYEGSKTLFRIALAIFKIGENEIKSVGDPMEIFQVVQTIPRRLIDANALIEACFKRRNGFGHLSQETVEQKRQERRVQVKAEREKQTGNIVSIDSDFKKKGNLFGRRR
ncbi:TBC domain-containing protein [Daldinia vernicosa]|uniref:TBC domain-containing protein n=1 Tax=Daldinia vernicosa TaxID=114800 RepID=UPI0020085E09|nr:TBC domain-containing protein [Daldinia vernicosa]KAI0850654.1 TBC domain-containing protein [Daldinia vernicosa]